MPSFIPCRKSGPRCQEYGPNDSFTKGGCLFCYLAAVDPRYQKKWNIVAQSSTDLDQAKRKHLTKKPKLSIEELALLKKK